MKRFAILLWIGFLAGCATEYQPQSFTGGFSDYMTAPDEAMVRTDKPATDVVRE